MRNPNQSQVASKYNERLEFGRFSNFQISNFSNIFPTKVPYEKLFNKIFSRNFRKFDLRHHPVAKKQEKNKTAGHTTRLKDPLQLKNSISVTYRRVFFNNYSRNQKQATSKYSSSKFLM